MKGKRLKKRLILALALVAMIAFLLVSLLSSPTNRPQDLPRDNSPVTQIGRYFLDDERFVEVVERYGEFRYLEGMQSKTDPKGISAQVVSYHSQEVSKVALKEGWSIRFTPPNTLHIDLGGGG